MGNPSCGASDRWDWRWVVCLADHGAVLRIVALLEPAEEWVVGTVLWVVLNPNVMINVAAELRGCTNNGVTPEE
jgi:hypothetical protein